MAQKVAIISVDGHVKPPRRAYLDYVDPSYREALAEALASTDGTPDGFVHPNVSEDVQWDASRRLRDLESQGVVAEVLFSNGQPFEEPRVDHSPDPGMVRASNTAYNRWLVDFCSAAPGRLCGLAAIAFDDVDQAVADVHWAKDHGLGGVLMPPLHPAGRYFFDPALDPIWEACQEAGLPLNQHGGTGAPRYQPLSFASFMVLATEHSLFSGRSLWQLILGGVFDRFPDLKVAYVETEQWWMGPVMDLLDRRERAGDDWTEFAETLRRVKPYRRLPSEYWASNCYAGLSPFNVPHLELGRLGSADGPRGEAGHGGHGGGHGGQGAGAAGFAIRSENSMVGVDYPHPETVFPGVHRQVQQLLAVPGLTEADARKVLFENAADLYHFDLASLRPDIERIGFSLDDVPDSPVVEGEVHSLLEVVPTLMERSAVGLDDLTPTGP